MSAKTCTALQLCVGMASDAHVLNEHIALALASAEETYDARYAERWAIANPFLTDEEVQGEIDARALKEAEAELIAAMLRAWELWETRVRLVHFDDYDDEYED